MSESLFSCFLFWELIEISLGQRAQLRAHWAPVPRAGRGHLGLAQGPGDATGYQSWLLSLASGL